MTKMQQDLYNHFLESKATARLIQAAEGGAANKGGTKVLGAITALKKLCNHPKLIYDVINGKNEKAKVDGFKGCEKFFLPGAHSSCFCSLFDHRHACGYLIGVG